MKRAKYLFSIFFGTLVYVLLSMTLGQNSFKCFNQMEEQKRYLSKQTSLIQNINSELELELTALQNDKDVIVAYARKLDYVSNDEKLVKINGLKPAQTTLYDTGTVLRHVEPGYLDEKYCKIIAIFFSLMLTIIMVLVDVNNGNFGNREKNKIVTGIPVYDLPQI